MKQPGPPARATCSSVHGNDTPHTVREREPIAPREPGPQAPGPPLPRFSSERCSARLWRRRREGRGRHDAGRARSRNSWWSRVFDE